MSDWKSRPTRVERLASVAEPERQQVIDQLARNMQQNSGDLDALNTAVEALSRLGAAAVPAVLALLHDQPAETRIAAALTLGQIGSSLASDSLLALLDDDDVNVRYHAIEALGAIGARQAVPRLASIVSEGDFFLLFPAISALEAIGDPSALPELLSCLDSDMVAEEALAAIGACGHPAALPSLANLLEQDRLPWGKVMEACERIFTRCEERFSSSRYWLGDTLERLAEKGLRTLLYGEPLGLSTSASEGACRLLAGLAESSSRTEQELEHYLRRVLSLSAYAGSLAPSFPIERLGEERLQAVASRASVTEKIALTQTLANSDSELAGPLLMRLMRDNSEAVRRAAAAVFASIKTGVGWEDLLPFAASSDEAVVAAVYQASERLQVLDSSRWEGLLAHPDPVCRRLASRAARLAKDLPADRLLKLLEGETDALVRSALLESALVRGEPMSEWLHQHWKSLSGSETALIAQNFDRLDTVDPWLSLGLSSRDVWTRLQAARWVSENLSYKDPIGEKLQESMSRDPLPPVRAAALRLERPSPESEVRLGEILSKAQSEPEPEVTRTALLILGALPTESASRLLQMAYESTDPAQRDSLLETLQEDAGPAAAALAVSLSTNVDVRASVAHLLWMCTTPCATALIDSALSHRHPEWLSPPRGSSPQAVEQTRAALRAAPWPEKPVEQAVWLQAAAFLGDEEALLEPENIAPWAQRAQLLGLLHLRSSELCRLSASLASNQGDPGLAEFSRLILRDHCADSR